jgi:hypothetical protein
VCSWGFGPTRPARAGSQPRTRKKAGDEVTGLQNAINYEWLFRLGGFFAKIFVMVAHELIAYRSLMIIAVA